MTKTARFLTVAALAAGLAVAGAAYVGSTAQQQVTTVAGADDHKAGG